MTAQKVTGRLAPSPTGHLHLGHALSFLASFWSTRSQGGRLVLRFEDVDTDRAGSEHIKAALLDLQWLGVTWDGAPLLQSERTTRLRKQALHLAELGLAYPCVCTRGDLARAQAKEELPGAPQIGGERAYPGVCEGKFSTIEEAEAKSKKDAGLRFATPTEPVHFDDAVFGRQEFNVKAEVGDFLVLRRNKTPAYQLAVVADDQIDGVTEVVRGRDLLSSTARQILVSRALNAPIPRYLHVPLVCDPRGRRLAKRDQDRSLADLRASGFTSDQILIWAARSLGQVSQPATLTSQFDANLIPQADIRLPEDLSSLGRVEQTPPNR
jgi:glutamyl-tRNA synthetase